MTKHTHAIKVYSEPSKPMRAAMQLWYTLVMKLKLEAITPRDLPQHRVGDNAWRVLLFGNGPTHGWGVLSHHFSLTGQLGFAMSENHNKRVNVDYVGDELMNIKTAADWLGDVDLALYDQVVLCVSWSDAVRLTPLNEWRHHYEKLIENIRSRVRPATPIVLVGIEPIEASMGYVGLGAKLTGSHAAEMNVQLQQFAAAENTAYAALGARTITGGRPLGSPLTYRAWANQIAEVAAPMLPVDLPVVPLPPKPKFSWIGSEYALGFAMGNFPNSIAQIEDGAKKALGADLAQITILTQDRQWITNHTGPAPQSVPRHLTYCDTAVKQDDVLVVPNGPADERFKDNEYLKMSSMPFYAGTALRSRSGDVIGSFCVLGIVPRPKQFFNRRKYAVWLERAQAEIWRIEDEAKARTVIYDI